MGKYIVELKKNETLYKAATRESDGTAYVCSAIGTPYTEPDLEQVRKEAYEEGYKKCLSLNNFGHLCVSCDKYEQGLADAWEAARKIFLPVAQKGLPANALIQIFGNKPTEYILKEYSSSEAIEKIRQYEQEKEEQIQVGDEVIADGRRCVVIELETIEKYGCIMDAKGGRHIFENKDVEKTGRHFPEIAEVLQKMKEADNG